MQYVDGESTVTAEKRVFSANIKPQRKQRFNTVGIMEMLQVF